MNKNFCTLTSKSEIFGIWHQIYNEGTLYYLRNKDLSSKLRHQKTPQPFEWHTVRTWLVEKRMTTTCPPSSLNVRSIARRSSPLPTRTQVTLGTITVPPSPFKRWKSSHETSLHHWTIASSKSNNNLTRTPRARRTPRVRVIRTPKSQSYPFLGVNRVHDIHHGPEQCLMRWSGAYISGHDTVGWDARWRGTMRVQSYGICTRACAGI